MRKKIEQARTTYRRKTTFLLLPKTLHIGSQFGAVEERWLETATWEQKFYPWISKRGGFWSDEYWIV